MDYCLLEDAYKGSLNIANATVGCTDNMASDKQQKHERKKHKRSKDCFKPADPTFNPEATDPDRPAMVAKNYSEAFQSDKIELPKPLPKTKLPAYFLGNDDEEGFTNSFSTKDDDKGFTKASGSSLVEPSLNDNWKPLTASNNNTAYFNSLPTPGGSLPMWNKLKAEPRTIDIDVPKAPVTTSVQGDNNLQIQINDLLNRLKTLETQYTSKPNNQQEILAFVSTGAFVICALYVLRR